MLLQRLFRRRKKTILKNYTRGCRTIPQKKALLYYKTDVFFETSLADRYVHTNNWEIICIAQVLNQLGFSVDIVDRTVTPEELDTLPYTSYDLFLGIGAGNSGRYFARIAAKLPQALKIFYAAGPDPDQSNAWIREQYAQFSKRHPEADHITPRRTIDLVDITESMRVTDAIFCIGNAYTSGTYKKYGKPIQLIRPSSSPLLSLSTEDLASRNPQHFLYFGGSGHIVKGLDLVVETFQALPDHHLFICGPEEPEFEQVYHLRSDPPKNIHWIGFVDVAGEQFRKITSDCSYIILPSCSEGIATSVTTCLRRGLIPLVTKETGIDTEGFGYVIEDPYNLAALRAQIAAATHLSTKERTERMIGSYLHSFQYTQGQFERDITSALLRTLNAFDRL